MKHEAAQLAHQTHQGTLAGLDPTHPADDEQTWEAFCSWHLVNWGWTPTKDQRDTPQTHVWSDWIAYQAGVTLGLEAKTVPAPVPAPDEVALPFDEELWERFSTYYKDVWGHQPSRRAAMMPRSRIRYAWEIFQAALTIGRTELPVKKEPVPAPVRAYDPIWAKFVLYYESFGRGTPEREDLDNPLMDVQEHYNLFKAEYHTKRETLRDEFAGQAMQGLLSRYPVGSSIDKPDIAYQSYRMAQEMMRMRDKQIRNP